MCLCDVQELLLRLHERQQLHQRTHHGVSPPPSSLNHLTSYSGSDLKSSAAREVLVPSFIVVNLSNDGYFLPTSSLETEHHLLDFLEGVLNGSVEVSQTRNS